MEKEMGEVKIRGRELVKAAGEPWRGTEKMAEWEQMVALVFVPTVFFYGATGDEWGKVVGGLKASLAEALTHFYTLAARLQRDPTGTLELLCENQGVVVTEAESSSHLADFGDFSSCFESFHPLIPSADPINTPLPDLPIVSVQLTRFRCGSFSIGTLMSHGLADGMSAFHFLTEWSRLARGEPLQTPPCYDRKLLRAGEAARGPGFTEVDRRAPEAPPFVTLNAMPPMRKETTMALLPLSKAQTDKLKSLANESDSRDPTARPYSRYEFLTAHIWRCISKVKGSRDEEEKKVLAITLDARSRMSPALPWSYSGNAVVMVGSVCTVGELTKRDLGYVCGRIRETIGKVTGEFLQAEIDNLKIIGPMAPWRGIRNPVDLSLVIPDLAVISWLTLSLQALDFGWGSYVHMSPGPNPNATEGISNILPGKEPGSAVVVICLKVEDVDNFNSHFYQFLD